MPICFRRYLLALICFASAPLLFLTVPLRASTGLLRSGLLLVLAGGAAMPIGPSFLAARSHGILALHLYIHST
ncbi:hypothetical protein EDB83DRAFT_2468313, partial [Lactarius deliciosus]